MNPFLWYTPLTPEQEESLDALIDDIEGEDTPDTQRNGTPTPETGYLTCSKNCGFINPYEFPKKGFVCKGCRMWIELQGD